MAKKILAICAALMAFAALPAVAFATNAPELVEGGTRVATGTNIVGTNEGNTIMTPGVECSKATMTGSLTKNDGKNVEGTISSATFSGTATGGACTGSFGNVTVTTNVTNGLNWCLRSTEKMKTHEFQVRGGGCGETTRAIRFVLDIVFGGKCVYERASSSPVVGTYTTEGTQASLTISEQGFPLIAGESSFICPEEGKLDMTFKLETEDGTALTIQ